MNLTCDEIRELAPSYVLGALDTSTQAAVRDHLASCPEAHDEFAEFGGLVPYLLEEPEPVLPRPELRTRVMASFAAETGIAGAVASAPAAEPAGQAAVGPASAMPRRRTERRESPLERLRRLPGRRAARWALAGAAVVAIVALAFGNVLLQSQAASERQYAGALNRALALAATPGARVAVMAVPGSTNQPAGGETAGTPGGIAVLPVDGAGVLVMHNLPATEGAQVYEVWLVADGQAAPVGSFRVGSDGYGYLEGLAVSSAPGNGLTVGLTREPGPGATKPTLPMIAAGTAQARSAQ